MGNCLPSLFSHERTIAELKMRYPEPFSGNGVQVPDNKCLFAIAFQVNRNGIPAVMDGDLDYHVLDSPAPECRDGRCPCPLHPAVSTFDRRNLNTEGIVSTFGNKVIVHTALVVFGKLDIADPRAPFPGNDRLDLEGLRFAFFCDPLVVAAVRAPYEQVAGFGNHFVFGLVIAFRAAGGDKH